MTFDVVIVGGGIIGGSIAFELARHGMRVAILDRQQPGMEASWAAAGMLAPGPETPESEPLARLARQSFALYPAFVSSVEEASGRKVGFRAAPSLHVFFGPEATQSSSALLATYRRLGIEAASVSPDEAVRMEPQLNRSVNAALLVRDEGRVDNRLLTTAVHAAAAAAGVEFRTGVPVTAIDLEKGGCRGVLAGEEKFAAQNVVIAAGCYSGKIRGAERFAPMRPIRGQIVALRPAGGGPAHVLRSDHGYLVPRDDGRVIAGSTSEDAGFEKRVTPAGLQQILDAAIELAPQLESAEVVESWSGLRPDTPDHLPILGPTGVEGLWMATGHYRNGILLAPVTARLMREWICEGKPQPDAERFSPLRFAPKKMEAPG